MFSRLWAWSKGSSSSIRSPSHHVVLAEDEHHRDVGAYAATAGVDVLVTVGPRAAIMLNAFDGEGYAVGTAQEAAALAGDLLGPGDVLLVKGSRGVGLEVVAETLAEAES